MAISRLIFPLCLVFFVTLAFGQSPESKQDGKIDRSKLLKPIDLRKKPTAKPQKSPSSTEKTPPISDPVAVRRPEVVKKKPQAMDIVIEPAIKPTLRKGFLIESKSMNPKVFFPIKGAEDTVLAAAYEWDYGVKTYTKDDWGDIDVKLFAKDSIALADQLLEEVEPRYVRDYRDVIEYAVLTSDDPFISSVIISKKFIDHFESKLGDQVHAIVIGRKTIYLFPASTVKLDSFADALIEQYNDALEPVSLEIFSISRTGYEVIGNITQ